MSNGCCRKSTHWKGRSSCLTSPLQNASESRKALQEGEAAHLKRLLARRFGALPDAVQVRLTTADVDQLEEWAIKVLDAESLDEVFDQRPQ
ncbi:MAG: DUF4351 domain-containing protein [Candidatus Accumulibacter sp.]|uniref:DUF4351 domain-containing protein n=1 Tax=Candidatus Accumulibacter proximus TaxID=2954385 RepID=A0A935PUB5_9PROT|nr:DUF4351 domain-containing protein [Candidatus Accumulibacter proximus]